MDAYIATTDPIVVARAEGVYLHDVDGTRYLDANGSWWVSTLGHRHPRLVRALVEQGLLGKSLDVVAVNDLVPADNLAYLLKYDSTQGRFSGTVSSEKSSASAADDDTLVVNGHKI